jgi:hypothetical protein
MNFLLRQTHPVGVNATDAVLAGTGRNKDTPSMLDTNVPTKGSCPDQALQRAGSSCMMVNQPRNNEEPVVTVSEGPSVPRFCSKLTREGYVARRKWQLFAPNWLMIEHFQ